MLDAASHGRDGKAKEVLPIAEIPSNITVQATTNYPVWREDISVTIDSVYITNTKKFVSARTLPKILIYEVGAQKSLSSPITKLKWAPMNSPWPMASYYSLVPSGEYEFQLALEIYDDEDQLVDVIRTPRQKYSSVFKSNDQS